MRREAWDFSWTVNTFVRDTAGITDAIVVSADGLPIVVSDTRGPAEADRLAAIVSGLAGLADALATAEELGPLGKIVMDLAHGYLIVVAIGQRALLGVRARKGADLATIAYEMTVFANRAGSRLTSSLVDELQNARSR